MESTPEPDASSIRMPSAKDAFTIYYFALATHYPGRNTEFLRAPLPLGQLFPTLEQLYPGFMHMLPSCSVSLKGEYVEPNEEPMRLIGVGDEVAIVPPVSSG